MNKTILLTIVVISTLLSCTPRQNSEEYISVTIAPLQYIVNSLTDSSIKVNTLIPKGMSPESGDFSIETLKKLHDSKACIYFGTLPFEEAQLLPALQNDKSIKGVALAAENHTHQHSEQCTHEHHCDPHVWLSVRSMKKMSLAIANELIKLYPEKSEEITNSYIQLSQKLDSLDQRFSALFSQKEAKSFIIFHPALTAFAADYGLEQLSIEEHGKEPSPGHLQSIIEQAKSENVKLLLMQGENDKTQCRQIADECGATIVIFNPLAENYIAEMERLADNFEKYME